MPTWVAAMDTKFHCMHLKVDTINKKGTKFRRTFHQCNRITKTKRCKGHHQFCKGRVELGQVHRGARGNVKKLPRLGNKICQLYGTYPTKQGSRAPFPSNCEKHVAFNPK